MKLRGSSVVSPHSSSGYSYIYIYIYINLRRSRDCLRTWSVCLFVCKMCVSPFLDSFSSFFGRCYAVQINALPM